MKVYIQQITSDFLYSAKNGWVKNVLEADAFATTIDALNECLRKDLANVQIRVQTQGETGYDTVFSVADFPSRTKVPAMK